MWRCFHTTDENAASIAPVFSRQRLGEDAQRGGLTGPSPTDRGKLGTKRHVLTDGRGVAVGVTLTGANIHDKWIPDRNTKFKNR